VANEAERAAITRALGLESLESLTAEPNVAPGPGATYAVKGRLTADVVQACVVTLAPVPAQIAETISRQFSAAAKPEEKEETEEGWVDPEDEIVDALSDGILDLGEVVTEQLSLSLNPYPRAPGATFGSLEASAASGEAEGPFAALAALKGSKAAPRRGDRP